MKNTVTLVTGLWDIGRSDLGDFGRSFDHYLEKFEKLLSLDINMIIWVPKELNSFVEKHRKGKPTKIINREVDDFDKWFEWYDKIQDIRKNPTWLQQASWLPESPQAKLSHYNPIVMSKFFMLNDSTLHDPFGSEYMFWIDGGLVNTVHIDTLKNVDRLASYMKECERTLKKDFVFLSFPYDTDGEVHGYYRHTFDEMCGQHATYVCRGGFFGGSKKTINSLNGDYYSIASESFGKHAMGTEECFHTIMSYKLVDKIHVFPLDSGMVSPFFEKLGGLPILSEEKDVKSLRNYTLIEYDPKKDAENIKTSLYILTFNSPKQFAKVAQTWMDNGFDKCHRRILIDNSTDPSTYTEYQQLCDWYYFEHIKKEENIGICGARQFVAEHFNESDSEYYVFIEDDMHLNYPTTDKDKFDYPLYVDDLYYKSLSIIHKNYYDFLKLTYCEFFGDNSTAWSWYNVPQHIRDEYWPDYNKLPENGLDPDAPKVEPTARKRYKSLAYLEGAYHYCNWPMWMSREGNKKIFLETTWKKPFEQTWMSNTFQLQMKNKVNAAILEASPITHERYDFYPAEERIES